MWHYQENDSDEKSASEWLSPLAVRKKCAVQRLLSYILIWFEKNILILLRGQLVLSAK